MDGCDHAILRGCGHDQLPVGEPAASQARRIGGLSTGPQQTEPSLPGPPPPSVGPAFLCLRRSRSGIHGDDLTGWPAVSAGACFVMVRTARRKGLRCLLDRGMHRAILHDEKEVQKWPARSISK